MTAIELNKILLVEDYPANVMVATTYLEEFGYSYDVASTGTDALRMAQENTYLVILMDVQMAGMNGYEATRLIREHEKTTGRARTHIIGMTAHALSGDREKCLNAGMDDYIAKPFSPEVLKIMLRNAA